MKKRFLFVSFIAFIIVAIMLSNPLLTGLTETDLIDEDLVTDTTSTSEYESSSTGNPIDGKVQKQSALKNPYGDLVDNIKGYISDKEGTYAVYFISLTSGQSFGINEDKVITAASTIKVPVNLYLFDRVSQNKINPNKTLVYTEADYEEGTGIIQYEDFGKKYSLRELSRLSIESSDNVAINMLIRHLGRNNILKFMESIAKHPVNKKRNVTSAKDMALYLKALLDMDEKYSKQKEELIGYLEHTEFNDRMPLYLPPDVPVAHKIGTQVGAIHDVGIVFAEKPFILSILSENVDEELAPDIIGQMSRMVYDFEQDLDF